MNSRSMIPLSADPDDFEAFTVGQVNGKEYRPPKNRLSHKLATAIVLVMVGQGIRASTARQTKVDGGISKFKTYFLVLLQGDNLLLLKWLLCRCRVIETLQK